MTRGRALVERLTEDECASRLALGSFGRVGVTVDGHPGIFPVNYVYDEAARCVVLPLHPGRLLDAILDQPEVAFEVDGYDVARGSLPSGWSVLVVGRARLVIDSGAWHRAERLLAAPWVAGTHARWVELAPVAVSGRRMGVV